MLDATRPYAIKIWFTEGMILANVSVKIKFLCMLRVSDTYILRSDLINKII